jgi:hypothetical protein
MLTYYGIAKRCYSNSAAMLLSSLHEEVAPSLIEALTGMGLGAMQIPDGPLFFDQYAPDLGLSAALTLLGFDYTERSCPEDAPPPFDTLRSDLEAGPVLLGPVDYGCLPYIPGHEYGAGSDHYIVAYAMDDATVRLHDPAGFPHVSLSLTELANAWRGERIGYRRGAFRCWRAPRRTSHPTADELYAAALSHFRHVYSGAGAGPGWLLGADAICGLAERARNGGLSDGERGLMIHFSLALGASRAQDYAQFFASRDARLASLKERQSELFGAAHTLAMRRDDTSLANTLTELAGAEQQFRAALLTA